MRKWRSSKFCQSTTSPNLNFIDYVCCSRTTEVHFLLRIGVSVKQQFTEEEIYKDRDSQISAIEKTFEDAQKSVSWLTTRNAHLNAVTEFQPVY